MVTINAAAKNRYTIATERPRGIRNRPIRDRADHLDERDRAGARAGSRPGTGRRRERRGPRPPTPGSAAAEGRPAGSSAGSGSSAPRRGASRPSYSAQVVRLQPPPWDWSIETDGSLALSRDRDGRGRHELWLDSGTEPSVSRVTKSVERHGHLGYGGPDAPRHRLPAAAAARLASGAPGEAPGAAPRSSDSRSRRPRVPRSVPAATPAVGTSARRARRGCCRRRRRAASGSQRTTGFGSAPGERATWSRRSATTAAGEDALAARPGRPPGERGPVLADLPPHLRRRRRRDLLLPARRRHGAVDRLARTSAQSPAPTSTRRSTGTVVGLRDYVLDGKTYGSVIDIQPTSDPSVVVSISHIAADPALTVGTVAHRRAPRRSER